jgi:hypothetical protein
MLRVMPQNWDKEPPKDWAEREAHRVALEIKRLRDPRSAQWLADRTRELGHTVSRTVIADLENGRRRYITTAELVVLAAALETAPIALLYPPPYSEDVEVLPGQTRQKISAVQEFSGFIDEPEVAKPEFAQNVFALTRARQIASLLRSAAGMQTRMDILDGTELGDLQQQQSKVTRDMLARLKVDDGW